MAEVSNKRLFDPSHPLAHVGKSILVGLALLALVVVYYLGRYAKGAELVATLLRVAPLMVISMVILNSTYFILQGGLFKNVYRAVGFRRSLVYLTAMYLGMNLVNTIAPVAGLSGSIYMMHFEKERGLSRSDTLLINFFYYALDYSVFLLVLLGCLIYLILQHTVTPTILVTSSIFAIFTIGVAVVGIIAFTHSTALHTFVQWVNSLIAKILRRKEPFLKDEGIYQFAEDAREAWQRSRSSRQFLLSGAVCALFLHVTSIIMLWAAFLTFQVNVSPQVVVSGYTVATLLNIVSPTPGGIGIAEGGMTAVFTAFGIPVEQALLVSLLYRTVFVWYPLGLGLIALHALPKLAGKESSLRV
jgi:uncharacterized protein (TIRG00374 family)